METKITKTIKGLTVTVEITRAVKEAAGYADGWNVSLGKEIHEHTSITIEQGWKSLRCDDLNFFYPAESLKNPLIAARFGDGYISAPVYDAIRQVLAEAQARCTGDAEYIAPKKSEEEKAAKQAEETAKINASDKERRSHVGWCNHCHSYCYGDCQAN
jgi:hypothetical protein